MEYYELSTTKCQSAQQQAFNNDMVVVVQEVCTSHGWKFAECFDSKGLRDRIRYVYLKIADLKHDYSGIVWQF